MSTTVRTLVRSQDTSGWTITKVEVTSTTFTAQEFWEGIKAHPSWAALGLVSGIILGAALAFLLF